MAYIPCRHNHIVLAIHPAHPAESSPSSEQNQGRNFSCPIPVASSSGTILQTLFSSTLHYRDHYSPLGRCQECCERTEPQNMIPTWHLTRLAKRQSTTLLVVVILVYGGNGSCCCCWTRMLTPVTYGNGGEGRDDEEVAEEGDAR